MMMIDLLLKYGANVDVRIDAKHGYTVLMKLASTDFDDKDRFDNIIEIIQFLIERGANKNIKGHDGKTIFDIIKKTKFQEELITIINDTQQSVFYSKNLIDAKKNNPDLDINDVHDLRTNCCKFF